ncbi:MAG: trimethylamine methyltransferase family protein [Nitrospirota bacterium]
MFKRILHSEEMIMGTETSFIDRIRMQVDKDRVEGGLYRPLSAEDVVQIHEASMRVFEEIGVRVKNEESLDLFAQAGARIDGETSVVKMDEDLVLELIDRAPSMVHLYGQRPEHTLHVGGSHVYAGTGGTALYVLDPGTEERRRATLADLKDIARVVDRMPNIDFFMLPVFPSDVDEENVDVNRFGAALSYQGKHVTGGVYTAEGVRNVIRMAAMIAGSEKALREKPLVSFVTCCGISPFVLDDLYSALAMEVARAGLPVITPVEPLCGTTSPVTLAANLVVQNVDTLAGVALTQLVNPGTPVMYGCISSIADMKDLKYLSGAVEMGMMNAGASQLARHYGLPIYATAGMSDSKTLDAQSGYESAITNLLVALAGGNYIHDAAGLMEFCMTASLEKYVMDDEILGMVMRAVRGIEVNEKTLAFDEMKKIGPGGHYVSSRHTRRFMRKEQFIPRLSDRKSRHEWNSEGSPGTRERARMRVEEILAGPAAALPSPEVMERIRKEIPGIDAGVV